MAFSEFEIAAIHRDMDAFLQSKRPPASIRHQLDINYRVCGQSIEIFELRPQWQRPEKIVESLVAKATYVKTQRVWKIYWMRANGRWYGYEPCPEVRSVNEFAEVVEADPLGCFWG